MSRVQAENIPCNQILAFLTLSSGMHYTQSLLLLPEIKTKDIMLWSKCMQMKKNIPQKRRFWFNSLEKINALQKLFFGLLQDVFVTLYTLRGNKFRSFFWCKGHQVKVSWSSTLVSFERKSLGEYACQIWNVYLLPFRTEVCNRQAAKARVVMRQCSLLTVTKFK